MEKKPTERFSNRVDAYIKFRPSYPKEIINYLTKEAGLSEGSIIADIGSGTGLLSQIFLDNGNKVLGIEPNKPMRDAAEIILSRYDNFASMDGKAEKTGLLNNSVDFVTAGQSFHWFDRPLAKTEFNRILRPMGRIVLIWNERDSDNDPYQAEYDRIIKQFIPEYSQVYHKNITVVELKDLVAPKKLHSTSFYNFQIFDFDGVMGRLTSSSYCPDENNELFSLVKNELWRIFRKYQENSVIKFKYNTMLYWA